MADYLTVEVVCHHVNRDFEGEPKTVFSYVFNPDRKGEPKGFLDGGGRLLVNGVRVEEAGERRMALL